MAYISKITPLGSSESYDLKAAKLVTARSLKTKLDSTTAVTFDGSADQNAIPVTGTLGAANGGTGKTNLQDAANALINALSTGSSTPVDADYYISQYVSGGTTTTTYHRRPMSALYTYIQGKTDTRYVKKTGDTMTGVLTNSTNIWAGIDANGNNVSSGECDIGTGGPSGKIYFYNTSGGRGIYGFNSSSAGAYILTVDNNNNVSLNGNAATATTAAFVGKNGHTAAVTANEFNPTVGTLTLVGNVSNTTMSHSNNANAEMIIKTHPSSGSNYYEARLGFSSNGNLYYMPVNNTTTWKQVAYTDSNITGNAETATKANGLVDGTSTMTSAYNKAGLAYADYSWLAGWNGYELRAVAKTQFAQASHNHYQLVTEGDNRSVATTPNSYNNNLVFRGLKTNSAFGSPSSDTYSYVVGLRGWPDASGGNAYELAFNNSGIYCRNGATTSWGSWNKILTLSDGNSAYVKKAGDSMTGSLTIQAAGDTYVWAKNTSTGNKVWLDAGGSANHGIWSDGYYNNSTFTSSGKWIIYRGSDGEAHTGMKLYGAVWNDYAEYRITKDKIEPGHCVIETGKDDLVLSTERLQPGAEIVSDTFGFAIGETDEAKTPIATTGRVLAYIYEGREAALAAIGKPVCSGPNGTVSIMTDEEYQKYGYCAIGIISAVPDYEEWGTGKVKVNNRIWIRIR